MPVTEKTSKKKLVKKEENKPIFVDGVLEAEGGFVSVVNGSPTAFEGSDSFREAVRHFKTLKGI